MATIRLDALAHAYHPNPTRPEDYALRRLSQDWPDGTACALLGPSGCGKTTLLNIISGLVVPSEGRVLFDGRDVTRLPPERRNIAQVFQFPVIYDTMTVYDNLAFPLRNRKVERAEIDRRVRQVAELLDLSADLSRRAVRLTPDAKQKISMGRGLVRSDVAAMLFDEPLTVIDPHTKWQLRRKLREIHQEYKVSLIYVTHDQTEALTFADRIAVMHEGAIVQIGSPQDLFERPEHTFVGYFIGSPGMNILPARVSGNRAAVAGHELALAAGYPALPAGGKVEIGVRPEFTRLAARGAGLPVSVRRLEDRGAVRLARVDLAGQTLMATVPETLEVDTAEASVIFDPAQVHVYADGHRVGGRG